MPHLNHQVGRVRFLGYFEGISFLLLLGVAMPLKYLADMPLAVRWTGMIHGILFIAYCLVVLQAWLGGALDFKKSALAFFAAFIPFGPFLVDRYLAVEEGREGSRVEE
ncbi:MAG: DUF3817 domain-containing protein [Luteolibacter sp.]